MTRKNGNHKKIVLITATLAIAVGVISAMFFFTDGVPPPGVPSDGHNPSAVLATGTTLDLSNEEVAHLFESVATFHGKIPEYSEENPGIPASTCLACHSNIFDLEFVTRKMPGPNGTIELAEEKNQHQVHETKTFLNFGEACTFCHREFETEKTDTRVVIASYVDKTVCASCHSRFSPRGLMDRSYYEESGCPGCHDPGEVGAWKDLHLTDQGAFKDPLPYGPYMNVEAIDPGEKNCLICHGENKMKIPEEIQDLFWQAQLTGPRR